MRGLTGNFSLMPLPDLVDFLSRRQVTGSLTCERGTVRKTLQLREGHAVGAASTDPREFLGQLLINFGHLDEEQLGKAFRTQQETRVRLGKVLVMVDLLPAATLRDVLGIKIRETLLDVFRWDSGAFRVDDDPPEVPDDELSVSVPLADILKEAEFRATAWEAFQAQFPSGAATLQVDPARIPPGAGDGTIDGKLLMLAAHGRTIDEIGLALHATEFHLYQRLYALARQGVIRAAPEAIPAAPEVGDPLEVAELLDQAGRLLEEGRIDDAEQAASRALALAPGAEAPLRVLDEVRGALAASLRTALDAGAVPVLRMTAGELGKLRLAPSDRYLLSRCDGRRTLGQIAQVAPLEELEVLKAFRRYLAEGVAELHPGSEP